MKVTSVALLLVGLLAFAAVANVGVRASEADAEADAEDEGEAMSTSALDEMVADTLEADAEVADVEQFEAEVDVQNVDAEHAELTAEAEDEAAHEFDTETQDEVEADATETEEDTAVDAEAAKEVDEADAESEDEEEADAEEEESATAFVEADAESELEADAEADAESEAETEEEAGVSMHSTSELAAIASATATVEFEEDSASDAADDAEDAEARAEEQAFEAARFAEARPASSFDEAQAKDMFVYAQAAYYEADPAKCVRSLRQSSRKALKVAHTVTSELTDGATVFGMTGVDSDKKRVVIAFNGNAEPHELTTQLLKGKPFKVKSLCKSCKTHRYYVQAYKKVCPQITASVRLLLRKPEFASYPVWITGHGFGGALAQLCAFELEMSRVFTPSTEKVVITYGQPRVGNAHWARKFNQHFPSAVRVTHADDPMPHVPPCHVNPDAAGTADAQTCFELKDRKKKFWAFHSPTQIWYSAEMPAFDIATEKGAFAVCNGANWGEDPKCRNKPLGLSIDDFRNYYGVDVSSHCANLIDGVPADA